MRFIYVTDLHGDTALYDDALDAAARHGAALVVNGGDMLPKTGEGNLLENQRAFFAAFLRPHLAKARERGIGCLAMFGNDDCASLLPELDALQAEGLLRRLDTGWTAHGGWRFAGFPWVPDTPFLLKDWTRLDDDGWPVPSQYGPPMRSNGDGFEEIGVSSEEHHARLPSIRALLGAPPYHPPPDPSRGIFVMHVPPFGTGLDVCWQGQGIGSRAGLGYIERWGFAVTLHGHIHEAPREPGGSWHARIGPTTAFNPGADGGPSWLLIDTDARTAVHARRGETRF